MDLVQKQKDFFLSGKTRPLEFRQQQLQKLKQLLKNSESQMMNAIQKDFGKSNFVTYMSEWALVYSEIDFAIKNLKKWSKPKKVKSGLAHFPSSSWIQPEPLGTSLIMGAWNYPYQLLLMPLIPAIAAGNTAILKPSELTPECSKVIAELINKNFPAEFLFVAEGAVEVTTELLKQPFDKIFFTGSTAVGKIVAKAAAEHLSSVTLELGGKSPCFVLPDANLETSAKRIVWGKFLNAGQTCVAPDYVLVHESVEAEFLKALQQQIQQLLGGNAKNSEFYTRIVNKRHFERLKKLIDPKKVFCGGQTSSEDNYIEPTVLHKVGFQDEVMREEIFGPILPVITYKNLNETVEQLKALPSPLSLYIFGENSKEIDLVMNTLRFGSGAINDVVIQITNHHLPFGGVGQSGMGSYHGKFGFDTFSHNKSILRKHFWFEPNVKYPPYGKLKQKIIQFLLE